MKRHSLKRDGNGEMLICPHCERYTGLPLGEEDRNKDGHNNNNKWTNNCLGGLPYYLRERCRVRGPAGSGKDIIRLLLLPSSLHNSIYSRRPWKRFPQLISAVKAQQSRPSGESAIICTQAAEAFPEQIYTGNHAGAKGAWTRSIWVKF